MMGNEPFVWFSKFSSGDKALESNPQTALRLRGIKEVEEGNSHETKRLKLIGNVQKLDY